MAPRFRHANLSVGRAEEQRGVDGIYVCPPYAQAALLHLLLRCTQVATRSTRAPTTEKARQFCCIVCAIDCEPLFCCIVCAIDCEPLFCCIVCAMSSVHASTERIVARIHEGTSAISCPQPVIDFFSHANPSMKKWIAFSIAGTDRWSYSVHFSVLSSPRLVDILFLPHSTVHELTSNRIVLGNVLLPDISFVNPSALTSLSVKSRSDSQLYILSWTLDVNPGAAADHFVALLRKVCKEVGALNKMSFFTRQVCSLLLA
jgi:hypothetical protein